MAEVVVQSPTVVIPDDASNTSERSSSQASFTSKEGGKDKNNGRSKKQGSKQKPSKGHSRDPSLTSFPSFSQDPADQILEREAVTPKPERTISQKLQDRKATLAGLTSVSPLIGGRQNALFDDSPRSSLDIPGSLHLATDEHIERLIAKNGALKLVRQYASDLAQRDADISILRARADLRERELKRLLREANVPSAEIEKKLKNVEPPEFSTRAIHGNDPATKRKSVTSLDGMMNEAMSEEMGLTSIDGVQEISAVAAAPEPRKDSLAQSTLRRLNSAASSELNADGTSISRQTSQASSLHSHPDSYDATVRPRNSNSNIGRLTSLQSIFQPPTNSTSYFIGGSTKTVKKPKAVDELSVRSNNSSKSTSSWMRIFGGGSQTNRSRSSSLEQTKTQGGDQSGTASTVLTKVRSTMSSVPQPTISSSKQRPSSMRTVTSNKLPSSPNHGRKDSDASNLPPTVELDSMIESSELPPTMTSHNPENLLTDRFGFIYDKKRKRQYLGPDAQARQKTSASAMASLRSVGSRPDSEQNNRPPTPVSIDDDQAKKPWQEYLTPLTNLNRGRPKELLSHTPSAGAVVTVNTADVSGSMTPPRLRDVSISVSSERALPSVSLITEPQSSTITVTSSGFSQDAEGDLSELAATKSLLEQLTEVHDSLQAERTVKWNDFLRRVRAERANSADRGVKNAPEADLVDGELIGIATLGRSSKTKSKYMHFKSLVLAGIPVALRPKIWAECSGATQMRMPGYYEDLVTRSQEETGIDQEISTQIKADVKRTLRDNIFFRDPEGPGARRLEELLRAYSLHNPEIGYCQGMNLITASLLLICATSEDCFWLLVAIIDHILPSGYFDLSLLTARADQMVLRQYVSEVLPRLDEKLQELGIELEACTFHWFLSLYSGVLTGGEALYRIWDVVLCLNSSEAMPQHHNSQSRSLNIDITSLSTASPTSPSIPSFPLMGTTNSETKSGNANAAHDGTSSPFLFQLSLALLKLNEPAILALDSPATIYTYLNHNMTAHNITIDALVAASEALRANVKKQDVLDRRAAAIKNLT